MKHLVFSLLLICVITTSRAQIQRVTLPAASVALYLPPATSSKACPLWFIGGGICLAVGTSLLVDASKPCGPNIYVPCFDFTGIGVAFVVAGVPMVLMGLRCVLNKRRAARQVTE